MIGVKLPDEKRALILDAYLSQGFFAAKQMAIDSGISPYHISKIARDSGKSINRTKLERGAKAVNEMLAEFKIGREDLCHSRFREHIARRRIAVERLHALGLGYSSIAAVLKINESSVRYWLKPEHRAKQRKRSKISHRARMECRA